MFPFSPLSVLKNLHGCVAFVSPYYRTVFDDVAGTSGPCPEDFLARSLSTLGSFLLWH
jgi:hypothetical protein